MSQRHEAVARVTKMMHVIYYVSDVDKSTEFYCRYLGLQVVDNLGSEGVFLRFPTSTEYFDLGLVAGNPPLRSSSRHLGRGVYHVGWLVEGLHELERLRNTFELADLLVGSADHGTHLSVYAYDPDENEVEVCWARPRDRWPTPPFQVSPLDLDAELLTQGTV